MVSAIFFGGVPGQILDAWRGDRFTLLALILARSIMVEDSPLPESVSADADDDKFLACAVSSDTSLIVSGDRDLLDVSGYGDIEVLKPRDFVDRFLGT